MEIVTEPDMTNGKEAASFVKQLIAILQTLGVSDGRLEGGAWGGRSVRRAPAGTCACRCIMTRDQPLVLPATQRALYASTPTCRSPTLRLGPGLDARSRTSTACASSTRPSVCAGAGWGSDERLGGDAWVGRRCVGRRRTTLGAAALE